jgi:hypothetical protein
LLSALEAAKVFRWVGAQGHIFRILCLVPNPSMEQVAPGTQAEFTVYPDVLAGPPRVDPVGSSAPRGTDELWKKTTKSAKTPKPTK